ncbi:MAG: low affinity iron permease family protein [Candidatus Doudnabacteria bacterium]|nr:low affinity iron permease family protein [Candidatus Doudnabacteria bacterium]
MNEMFHKIARFASEQVGKPWAFVLALLLIITWGFSGPTARYSDTWQLVINTTTTVLTFLMVFLIQNTQNRDSKAINIKLDELLRAIKRARDSMVDVEDLSDEQLNKLQTEFQKIGKRAQQQEKN